MIRFLISILLLILFHRHALSQKTDAFGQFVIDASKIVGKNTEFWKAAGSDHLFYHVLRPSGQALLDRMERTQSHRYLRTHHTFVQDKKKGVFRGQNVYSEDKNGKPIYDFSNINKVFTEYVKRGIKPIVEYDYLPKQLELNGKVQSSGNDEGMKMRNTGPNDWEKWADLMTAATQNFIDKFGTEEVQTWYFEVWNEPDGWPLEELDVFFKMYDVFVHAVTSVEPKLKVGGPACYHEYFLRPFLNHVANSTNYVTGEKGTRIDFISYHIYGLSGKWLNDEPHIQPQVQRFSQSVLWLKRLLKEFPGLKGTPLHINEWGLSSNFWRTVENHPNLVYRNNHESALFLVKLVNALFQVEDNYNFPISLLLYWGFVGEADADIFFAGQRELTTAGNTPKPIQTGFEMLARLYEDRLLVQRNAKDNHLGLLATANEYKEMAFIIYNYEENERDFDREDETTITIKGLRLNKAYEITEISLDSQNHNTYAAWQKIGSPSSSKGIDITPLKMAATLQSIFENIWTTDEKGGLKLNIKLPRHSMKLITIRPK